MVVGDRNIKDTVVNLYTMWTHDNPKHNKHMLWAYKNKLLGFTSHRQKRENKIKKEIKRGIREANQSDPFELFVSLNNIRYVYYKETEKILGNTYGMCVLQDFEAITPNILARTIETVEGGGMVIMMLKGMKSLKQLYNLTMDVHNKYRTEAHDDVVARFNERFILSLGGCASCLVIDDEMNVLPISGGKNVTRLPPPELDDDKTEAQKELDTLKDSLQDTQPVGSLVNLARTTDQAKALLTFVDAISEKTLRSTVTLTAARGRGKSAAMGVAVAAAVAHGYSNIFITSPSPENLKTLFEFVFKGFDALGYADHADYSIIQSTNPDFNKAIVRVNITRNHRQTIQYIRPQDAHVLGQAELVVIDEAAAIPLPVVRKLMGPYLVFMASTINGYEGTGRSLSLKLIKQLRDQSRPGAQSSGDTTVADRATGRSSKDQSNEFQASRSLREITLSEPIRYAKGDDVEKWLNKVLCLDATLPKAKAGGQGCPDPSQCELLQVNRDTLFSVCCLLRSSLNSLLTCNLGPRRRREDAPADGGAVRRQPLQELPQRPAAHERRPGARAVHPRGARHEQQAARAPVRDPGGPRGQDQPAERAEPAEPRLPALGRPDPVAREPAVPGRGLRVALGRAYRAHRHEPGLHRHGLRQARAAAARRLLRGQVHQPVRGRCRHGGDVHARHGRGARRRHAARRRRQGQGHQPDADAVRQAGREEARGPRLHRRVVRHVARAAPVLEEGPVRTGMYLLEA